MEISGKKAIREIIIDPEIHKYLEIIYLYKTQTELINLCQKYKIKHKVQTKEFFNKHYSNKTKYKYKYAIAKLKKPKLVDLTKFIENFNSGAIVALDHIHDPFNIGAILRTCAASGVKGIIIPKNNQSPINHTTVLKASQGYSLKVNIIMVPNLYQAILKLKKYGFWIYSSYLDEKSKNFKTVQYHPKSVLVLGNEGKGISQIIKKESDVLIHIPMNPGVNSLNVSVAAGILLFEITEKITN